MNDDQNPSPARVHANSATVRPKLAASIERKSHNDPLGIEDQFALNREQARLEGWHIPDSPEFRFSDNDTSGASHTRGGFDRFMKTVASGHAPFGRVYVKNRTRFGRWDDPRKHFFHEVTCENHHVKIRYCDESDVDLASGEPEALVAYLQGAFSSLGASKERHETMKRTSQGIRSRLDRSFFPGSVAPYATERCLVDAKTRQFLQVVPKGVQVRRPGGAFLLQWRDDGSKEIVQEIFHRVEGGETMQSIATSLSARGVCAPDANNQWGVEATRDWSPKSIRKIITNPIYVGDLVWGRSSKSNAPASGASQTAPDGSKESVVLVDFMPDPPVDRARWQAVQEMMTTNRNTAALRRAAKPEFPLSGLLQCAECDAKLFGNGPTKVEGHGRRYYRHNPKLKSSQRECAHRNRYTKAELLEEPVDAFIEKILASPRFQEIATSELDRRSTQPELKSRGLRVERLEAEIVRLADAMKRAAYDRQFAGSEREREIYGETVTTLADQHGAKTRELAALQADDARTSELRKRLASGGVTRLKLIDQYRASDWFARRRAVRLMFDTLRYDYTTGHLDAHVFAT